MKIGFRGEEKVERRVFPLHNEKRRGDAGEEEIRSPDWRLHKVVLLHEAELCQLGPISVSSLATFSRQRFRNKVEKLELINDSCGEHEEMQWPL